VAAPASTRRAYSGLVSRLAALAVDVALVAIVSAAVRILPGVTVAEVLARPAPAWIDTVAGAVAVAVPWAYFTVSWWLNGQTVGDLILGLVVLRHDGAELTLPHAALRAAVGLLLAPVWLLGLVMVLWDDQRRALHDRVFHTVVRYAPGSRAVAGSSP
jgi:uncharacterized RDD family membrane protein YckC